MKVSSRATPIPTSRWTPEVARERLPKELQQGEFRSAYDEKSLARAIRMATAW